MLDLEGSETLQTLHNNLLWLDHGDAALIELVLLNGESRVFRRDQTDNSHVAVVVRDTAFQVFLANCNTVKTLLADGAITQSD